MKSFIKSFVEIYLESLYSTLTPEYISWLKEYVKEHKFFTDNPNTTENRNASEEDEERIYKISNFFHFVSESAKKRGIEVGGNENGFVRLMVVINLDSETTIEMITWIGQGAETQVTLVAPDSGKINLEDVLKDNKM